MTNDDITRSEAIKEEQLSMTFDDLSVKHGMMHTKEHLETREAVQKHESSDTADKERIPEAKTNEPPEEPKKVRAKLPQNLIMQSEPEPTSTSTPKPLSKPDPMPQKPQKPLSDMEVMEHTASVWQYKEITDDGTETRSEYHEKRTHAGAAEMIGARERGKKHKHEGTNCDDFFETAFTEDCAIVIVCDGAGSKPLSRIGARVSSESAAAYLKESLAKLFADMPEIKTGLCAELNSSEFMAACGRIAPLVQQSAR